MGVFRCSARHVCNDMFGLVLRHHQCAVTPITSTSTNLHSWHIYLFFFLWAVFISVVHWKKQTKQFTHADNFRGGVQVCGPPVENELSSPVFVCTPARSFVFHSAVGGLFGCLPQTGVSLDVVYVTQFLHWGDPKKCTHFVTFILSYSICACLCVWVYV